RPESNGVDTEEAAPISKTAKWRSWRVQRIDGSRVNVNIGDKPNGKASIAVEHTELGSFDDIEAWRSLVARAVIRAGVQILVFGCPCASQSPHPVRFFVVFSLLVIGKPLAYRFAVPEMPGAFNSAVYAVPLPITNRLVV